MAAARSGKDLQQRAARQSLKPRFGATLEAGDELLPAYQYPKPPPRGA